MSEPGVGMGGHGEIESFLCNDKHMKGIQTINRDVLLVKPPDKFASDDTNNL